MSFAIEVNADAPAATSAAVVPDELVTGLVTTTVVGVAGFIA
jgi:hypothetical protein